MNQRNNAGWIIILIIGAIYVSLGLSFILQGRASMITSGLIGRTVTMAAIYVGIIRLLLGGFLIFSSLRIRANKQTKMYSWLSLIISMLMILSISYYFAIILLIGSIISLMSVSNIKQNNLFCWIITILGGVFEILLTLDLVFYGYIPAGPVGFTFFTISLLILGIVLIAFAFLINREIIKNNVFKNFIFWISLILCISGVVDILMLLRRAI